MLTQLPRLTGSLRPHYDVDQAYLDRRVILQSLNTKKSNEESELARRLVSGWDKASSDARLAYRKFIASVVELVDGEVDSEEFQEIAKAAYDFCKNLDMDSDAFNTHTDRKAILQKLVGHSITDSTFQKVCSFAHKLSLLQDTGHETAGIQPESVEDLLDDDSEFGLNITFQAPLRFLIDVPSENGIISDNGYCAPHFSQEEHHYQLEYTQHNLKSADHEITNLRSLKTACDMIVRKCGLQLSGDELATALCLVLVSNKPGDEVAGELMDLVGDGAFDTVQNLLSRRKELVNDINHGLFILKSENSSSNSQPRMPSYGTQVTVQTQSEVLLDKLRRKDGKRNKRGLHGGSGYDLDVESFYDLIVASEKKQPFDDLIGTGDGLKSTALPEGTTRQLLEKVEEIRVPPTPTAPIGPDEKLIEIKELDDFAQIAFDGYETLNRIQSRIFPTAYYSNENILVCAPTGAGKTNIAMITILHEIKQHFRDGILHKNEFKIVYVAPMKALATEVTSAFSQRLLPLNITVKELTGDMQLSKNELQETQMIVTTPEKYDVITRKSSDMALSMLVKLLIIDEVHLLNDERGPVIEALVARTLRQVESTQSMIRIVGLSATLPNYKEVAQFLRVTPATGLFFFDSGYRPVPLAQQYIGISEKDYAKKMKLFDSTCYEKVINSLKNKHQVMVFVHSRKDTVKTARTLPEYVSDIIDALRAG